MTQLTTPTTTSPVQPEVMHCYRHPDRETLIRCARCDRPICLQCQVRHPVGIRCKVQGLEYAAWINLGRRGRNGPPDMDGVLMWMWGHGLPGDPAIPFAGHLHSFVAGKGWGSYSYTDDKKADEMVEELKGVMDPEKREALIKQMRDKAAISRYLREDNE